VRAGTKFCTSNEPTIADLQIYHQLSDAFWHQIPCDNYPKVIAWRCAMYEIPQCGKVNDQWQTGLFPNLDLHDKSKVVDTA